MSKGQDRKKEEVLVLKEGHDIHSVHVSVKPNKAVSFGPFKSSTLVSAFKKQIADKEHVQVQCMCLKHCGRVMNDSNTLGHHDVVTNSLLFVSYRCPPTPSTWKVVYKDRVAYRSTVSVPESRTGVVAEYNDVVRVIQEQDGWIQCDNGQWLPTVLDDQKTILVRKLSLLSSTEGWYKMLSMRRVYYSGTFLKHHDTLALENGGKTVKCKGECKSGGQIAFGNGVLRQNGSIQVFRVRFEKTCGSYYRIGFCHPDTLGKFKSSGDSELGEKFALGCVAGQYTLRLHEGELVATDSNGNVTVNRSKYAGGDALKGNAGIVEASVDFARKQISFKILGNDLGVAFKGVEGPLVPCVQLCCSNKCHIVT